jgi:hypothetical protein
MPCGGRGASNRAGRLRARGARRVRSSRISRGNAAQHHAHFRASSQRPDQTGQDTGGDQRDAFAQNEVQDVSRGRAHGHSGADFAQVQLQRASLPRLRDGDPDPPVAVRPRTWLLRHGLDRTPPAPYFLHEEEVSRAGVRVSRRYRRTRWRDGRVWCGLPRSNRRAEGRAPAGLRSIGSST